MVIYNISPTSYALESNDISGTSVCLITHTPLESDHIKLDCGHEYNYEPFMRNIMMQSKMRNASQHIRYRIICPYCRAIQHTQLIPFYDKYYGVIPYMYGIHSLDLDIVQAHVNNTKKRASNSAKIYARKPRKKPVKGEGG
jgi:hypothetical protein